MIPKTEHRHKKQTIAVTETESGLARTGLMINCSRIRVSLMGL